MTDWQKAVSEGLKRMMAKRGMSVDELTDALPQGGKMYYVNGCINGENVSCSRWFLYQFAYALRCDPSEIVANVNEGA